MARVVAFLGSARKDGYTVKVLAEMLRGVQSVSGVAGELVHLLDYQFGPCRSCYECIRLADHRCILADDMGDGGKGRLWQEVEKANGIILATPVHCWTADALIHLFVERLYPFLWSGELKGIPAATLSVASNQGFQIVANAMLCEWAFTMGARYVGGLPVHTAYLEDALRQARYLGREIGAAALRDEGQGRRPLTDEEMWLHYQDAPWSAFMPYVENLTMGTRDPGFSIIRKALVQGTFQRKEAVELLRKADDEFKTFAHYYRLGDLENALKSLVTASTYWTHATWREFLQDQLIRTSPPEAYRPME